MDAGQGLILDNPAQGTVRVERHSNQFIYTPKNGASGTDTFTYYAIDGKDRSNYATVTIALDEQQGGGETPPGNEGGGTQSGNGGGGTSPGNREEETPVENGGEETPLGSNIEFNDIQGHWAKASIMEAARRGIIVGYKDGTFRPQQTVTRAQFIVMLQRALGLEGSESSRSFTDLQTVGAWAHSPLLKTVEAGWLTGYPDGTVRPNAPLTRTMMAMIIAKALELQPGDAQQVSFADAEDIPAWGKAAVEAARSKGLIRGQASNRFNPDATTTRAEAATLILRLLELE